MAEVYGNLVIVVILVMEGVDRAATCISALTLDGGSANHEGSQPLPVTAFNQASNHKPTVARKDT